MSDIDTHELEQALRAAAGLPDPPADARAGLADRAAADGVLDVAYAVTGSPLGDLLLARTPRGLARIAFVGVNGDEGEILERLADRLSPRILEAPRTLDDERRQLDDYFAGQRRGFELDVDLALVRGFGRDILERTAAIPFGEVSTYAEVAAGAGRPKAVRAAGNALGNNPVPIVVPCHRVLRTGGGLGGYTGGLHIKEHLLRLEGVLPPTLT